MSIDRDAPRWGRRGAALLLVATALTSSLAACGQGDSATKLPPGAKRSFDLYQGNNLALVDHAVRQVRNKCLADAGYPQNLNNTAAATNPFEALVVTAKSFGATSEDEARRLGFGLEQHAQPARILSFDPNYDQNLGRCEKQAWGQLGQDGQKVYDSYFQLGNKLLLFRVELDTVLPTDLNTKMLDCLESKGYKVPDRPAYLKAPDQKLFGVKFGDVEGGASAWEPKRIPGTVEVGPAVPARRYIPSAQESELAVAFYQCRQKTRVVELSLAAVEQVQAKLVTKYEAEFAELNPKMEQLARKAAELAGK